MNSVVAIVVCFSLAGVGCGFSYVRVTADDQARPCARQCQAKATSKDRLQCYRACPGVRTEEASQCHAQQYPFTACEGQNDNAPNAFFGTIAVVALLVVIVGYIGLRSGGGYH